jgi:flagellar hook-associated protein 1 FlgK
MGNLFTTLLSATNALQVYGRVFNTIQNNISNVNTPGYVRQEQSIVPLPFDPAQSLAGGILPGPLLSARSEYLEQNVRNQQEHLGSARQQANDLGQVEPLFDLTSTFGVPSALNKFFNGFSQLAVNPNDPVARQSVIDLAGAVAQSFNHTATGILQISSNIDSQTRDAVATVNRLAGQIAAINQQFRANSQASQDAGLDAQLHSALEELAGVANFTTIKTADGAVNLYLGGEAPLVIGNQQFGLQADLSGPQTVIRDAQGDDVTAQISRGALGALIEEKNATLPGYLAQLNQLAAAFADTVNNTLAQGVDRNGSAPAVNLFSYNQASDAAFTVAVTGITPDQIAAALPSAPGGNGNALAVAQLADAPAIQGLTFTQYFGALAANIGRDVAAAQGGLSQYQDALTQAQAQRQQQTGVSLDEEAARLIQFQQAYQAVGKLVGVLNDLTDSLLNIIH